MSATSTEHLDKLKKRIPKALVEIEDRRIQNALEYGALWLDQVPQEEVGDSLIELVSLLIRYRAHLAGVFVDEIHDGVRESLLDRIQEVNGLGEDTLAKLTEVFLELLPVEKAAR